jgi:hypothetical protein
MLMHERGGLIWGLNKLKGHPHAPHLMTLDLPCAASPCMLLVDDFHYFFFLDIFIIYLHVVSARIFYQAPPSYASCFQNSYLFNYFLK